MRLQLKELRIANRLTQATIAERAGIERTTYTNIERGIKNPSFKVASSIKRVLKTNDDDIFLDTNVT